MKKTNSRPYAPLSPARRRLFSMLLVLFPVLLLVCVELFLRAIHYGPNLSLFVSEEIGGKSYLVLNQDVKGRYFSHVDFTPNTSSDFFLAPKPAGTIRILCLGGSTTVGFPYGFIGSFSTFLRDRLHETFPGKSIEVINLGMTATNSFTVNDIAAELINYQPDLFIVYDGHNEFYGALGISSQETLGGSRWLVKAHLKLVHVRLYQLVKNTLRWVTGLFAKPHATSEPGTMMERLAEGKYVPYGSNQYWECLSIFKANLQELKEICVSKKIPLILGTQVSNVHDRAPFVSEPAAALSDSGRAESAKLLEKASESFRQGNLNAGLESCDRAIVIDSLRGDAHFLRGRILEKLGNRLEAAHEYLKARDDDQLRFRASSDFNQAIRAMDDHQSVFVTDVEQYFSTVSGDSTPGNELILEHLHPNLRGYFLMAKTYQETMKRHSLLGLDWSKDNVTDDALWNARPLTEVDERAAGRRIELLTAGWPFQLQSTPVEDPPSTDTLGRIVLGLTRAEMTWEEAHVKAAESYAGKRNTRKAELEYRAILNQIPLSISAYLRLAQLYLVDGNLDTAKVVLLRSLEVERTFYAARYLGAIALDRKLPSEAIPHLELAIRLATQLRDRSDAGYLLALAHLRGNHISESVRVLQDLLMADPRHKPARDLLQQLKSQN
ncbi:MAG: hypothetical protein WBD36_09475 [Bacteroidota bacterium]